MLVLLGFVATDFIVTITLSAADATAHVLENPFSPDCLHGHQVSITLVLIAILGAVFLKGFKEAIGIAVALVIVYLGVERDRRGGQHRHVVATPAPPRRLARRARHQHGTPAPMIGASPCSSSPSWRSGLSGFETGVAVMPLVKGDPDDTDGDPTGRSATPSNC